MGWTSGYVCINTIRVYTQKPTYVYTHTYTIQHPYKSTLLVYAVPSICIFFIFCILELYCVCVYYIYIYICTEYIITFVPSTYRQSKFKKKNETHLCWASVKRAFAARIRGADSSFRSLPPPPPPQPRPRPRYCGV